MKKLFLAIFVLVISSCNKEDNEIATDYFLLNSAVVDGKVRGFSFKNLKIIDYPNTNNLVPDFIVAVQTSQEGNIVGPFLSHPNLENVFSLAAEFEDYHEAHSFYLEHTGGNNSTFDFNALNIKPNQVWTIKTNDNQLGKLLIKKTEAQEINKSPNALIEFLAASIP